MKIVAGYHKGKDVPVNGPSVTLPEKRAFTLAFTAGFDNVQPPISEIAPVRRYTRRVFNADGHVIEFLAPEGMGDREVLQELIDNA